MPKSYRMSGDTVTNAVSGTTELFRQHKVDIVNLERQWIQFCKTMGQSDWKALLRTLTYENKGLGESFMRYLMLPGRIKDVELHPHEDEEAWRAIQEVYRQGVEPKLRSHLRSVATCELTKKWPLRREPKQKPIMGPDLFRYHLFFFWERDTSAFHTGLDRIDDVCLRQFFMWTGCRKHELVYAKPTDSLAKVREYDEESDAYCYGLKRRGLERPQGWARTFAGLCTDGAGGRQDD